MRGAVEKLRDAVEQTGSGKAASAAMANLAEAIQGLVHHMRTEQQMIRDWVDGQAEQQREIEAVGDHGAREGRAVTLSVALRGLLRSHLRMTVKCSE